MEERLETHRQFLVDRIEPDFGLLDKLLANKILTREALHKIKLKDNTAEDRNRILLDYIRKNKRAEELVAALRDIGQTHLANYINADGVYQSLFEDDWPLNESDTSQMDINRESLMDLLDTAELCFKLFAGGVLNNRQKQFICSKPTESEKNEALLDILIKCSRRQYKRTIVCLNNSNQSHVAKLLSDGGGVVVRVHAHIEGAVRDVDELEDEIISHLTKVLENRSLEEATRLLELTQMRIFAARKGHSIVIYIHCTTSNELQELIDLLKTKQLKDIVEMLFIELQSIALRVTLTWAQEELESAAKYLELECPYDLPSDGISHSKADKEERPPKLSSVGDWIRKRFNKTKRALAEDLKVTRGCPPEIEDNFASTAALLAGSQHEGERPAEEIQDCGLAPTSTNLNEEFVSLQQDLLRDKQKIAELERQLHHERSKCAGLEEARREYQEELKEHEQVVSDHTLIICKNFNWLAESLDPDSGLLSFLLERKVLSSCEYKYILSFTDRYQRNEILLSIMTRKTSDNFKEFQNAMISTLQSDIVRKKIFESPQIRLPEKIPDEYDQHTYGYVDIVCMSPGVKAEHGSERKYDPILIQTLRTRAVGKADRSFINGLTIVNKELFVVSQWRSEVEVFDSITFSFIRRWIISGLTDPLDIESCNRNKCLYILDCKRFKASCEMLRIDPDGNLIKNWSTGDDWGYGLSVSHDSTVILAVYAKMKLNEYSPDGRLIQEIYLPTGSGICHLWHAIKLTDGYFVISHGSYDLHRVGVVDSGGHLLKSFSGSTIGQMDRPIHLCVDGKGFVLVADERNHRVLLLDPDLKFSREILSKDGSYGLRFPERLLLDETNSRLFVVAKEVNNPRILIFDIT